jgi:hypothetical protein
MISKFNIGFGYSIKGWLKCTIDEYTHAVISGYQTVEDPGVKGNTVNVLNGHMIHFVHYVPLRMDTGVEEM